MASGFSTILPGQGVNELSDESYFERMAEALEDHPEYQRQVRTLSLNAHALTELYFRDYDSATLRRAIQDTKQATINDWTWSDSAGLGVQLRPLTSYP